MKIRNGFVSNSSSSSFVVRGVKMKEIDLAKILNIDPTDLNDHCDLLSKLYSKIGYGGEIKLKSTRDFFDGDETGEVIVGVEIADLNDGVVEELKDPDDATIKEKIEKKLGTSIAEPLKTYMQYISNDNY